MLRVNGGPAESGTRVVIEHAPWWCNCAMNAHVVAKTGEPFKPTPRMHPGTRYSCPDCGARRP